MIELSIIKDDLVMITLNILWDGTASDIFNWMSTDDDWQTSQIGNLSPQVVLIKHEAHIIMVRTDRLKI